MQVLTVSLSEQLVTDLGVLCDSYKIDIATFIRMAIYHGIRNIDRGYIPVRKKRKKTKKYRIKLPNETLNALEKAINKIKWTSEKTTHQEREFPSGELIEIFILMEIRGFSDLYSYYYSNDMVDESKLFDEHEKIDIHATLPKIFYNKIQEIKDVTGLLETKICNYLIMNTFFDECCHINPKVIVDDSDMINYANELGLNYLKLIMFLNAMVKSNKILLLDDELDKTIGISDNKYTFKKSDDKSN